MNQNIFSYSKQNKKVTSSFFKYHTDNCHINELWLVYIILHR